MASDLRASTAIPRLRARKSTPPSETLRPLLSQLELTMMDVCLQASQNEGREMLNTVSRLITTVVPWVKASADTDDTEISRCTVRRIARKNPLAS
jgi:hypothetical protein